MAKKKRPDEAGPSETPEVTAQERAVIVPQEQPAEKPKEVCGIDGCTTWYDDPAMMMRHRERQHGIGIRNLNRPLPRRGPMKLR